MKKRLVYAIVPEIREVEGALGVLYDVGTGGVAMDSTWTAAMAVGCKKDVTVFVTLQTGHAWSSDQNIDSL